MFIIEVGLAEIHLEIINMSTIQSKKTPDLYTEEEEEDMYHCHLSYHSS